MQIKHGASVVTVDEKEAGRVERVVIDPATREVTHLVVGSSLLFNDSRIIPIQMVASTDDERILLNADKDSFESLPYFEQTHYVSPVQGDEPGQEPGTYADPLYWYPPLGMSAMGYPGYSAYPYLTETEQNLPEELVALKDGAKVKDISGEEIGEIEKVIAGGERDVVTHFIVGWGLLQRSQKLVPTHWVKGVTEDQVRLAVRKDEVESLPEYTG